MTTQRSSTAGDAEPHSSAIRAAFHRDLERLELDLQAMGALARGALQRATRALIVHDQALSAAVVAGDDELDRRYLHIERRVIGLLARQAPVAAELRLLTAILHVSLHLERIGDMAVNIARLASWPRARRASRRWRATSRRWAGRPLGWSTWPCRPSATATPKAASGCR
jgi:Na+/phosphate symporter